MIDGGIDLVSFSQCLSSWPTRCVFQCWTVNGVASLTLDADIHMYICFFHLRRRRV